MKYDDKSDSKGNARGSEVLTIRDLSVRFAEDEEDTLKGVSFCVQAGEMVALVGESGSGKTLLCRSILGLEQKDAVVSGAISDGVPMSLVLQDPMTSLDPAMPVGKQILEAAGKKEKTTVTELLSLVGIPDPERAQHEYPQRFSGGMRQRVAIAIALAMRPQVLFADEPTTSLDADLSESIMELFAGIKETLGMAIVLVTHDLQLAHRYADRVLIMEKGRIVEQGNAREIFEHPQQEYTRQLLYYSTYSGHRHVGEVSPAKKPLVSVCNLCKSYKFSGRIRPVLQDISFDIHEGEMLGLYGASGIGKSTLLRQLCHLEKPTAGQVIYGDGLRQRPDVQIIFQDSRSALNPRMRIGELIGEGLRIRERKHPDEAVIQRLMERVELPFAYRNRYPHEISGGERQRVAIARAISTSPKLILADEPVSSLDVAVRTKIVHLLRRLKDEENLTLVFVSHDVELLGHVCDRIICLDTEGISG